MDFDMHNKQASNENKPQPDHEYSEICERKRSKLQRFGTAHSRRKTKAREPTPLVEKVGGRPHNMAEILPAEEVFKVRSRKGNGENGASILPIPLPSERLITHRPIRQRLANYVLMAD
ncbi:unnamed protein product, partial [Iphiclides podalirius]